MLILAMQEDGKRALTVGTLLWLGGSQSFHEMTPEEIHAVCRPLTAKQQQPFDDLLIPYAPYTFVLESDLPEGCAIVKGYWESKL